MILRLRARASQSGQSAVEFALILPTLLFILSGLFDFGRLAFSYITVVNAAQVGAEYGATSPGYASNGEGIATAALAGTTSLWGTGPSNPAVGSGIGVDGAGAQYVSVAVTYTFNTIFPYPALPSALSLAKTVQMRVQQ